MARQHIFCSACGAQGEAGCDCGAEYISASAFAARAIASNPQMSNVAISKEIGVSEFTVRKARGKQLRENIEPESLNGKQVRENIEPETRLGLDGKKYKMPKKRVTRRAKQEEAAESGHSFKAYRHIDTRTGENISRWESIKREAVHEASRDLENEITILKAEVANKESEVIELRAEVRQLTYELGQRPSMDDLRRIDSIANYVQRITTDIETYNLFQRCLHPDSRNSVSDGMLHNAWLAFRNLEPLTYDKSKLPPPLPADLDGLLRRRR